MTLEEKYGPLPQLLSKETLAWASNQGSVVRRPADAVPGPQYTSQVTTRPGKRHNVLTTVGIINKVTKKQVLQVTAHQCGGDVDKAKEVAQRSILLVNRGLSKPKLQYEKALILMNWKKEVIVSL